MIDVFIATVYSEKYFDYFLCFISLFFSFFHFVCMFLKQNNIFLGDVIVSCMTAGLGFKMAALNSKWRVCDVILTSQRVIIDRLLTQSVKFMTC